jgi:NAD(P)-dependent dehydrogenase (short-subunit alcohol dehydrogenase family)
LDGKVAIITGTTRGIGQAAAILFASEGARVVGAGRDLKSGRETARIIAQAGGESIFVRTEISKIDDVRALIDTAVSTYGRLDILYNNAAIPDEIEAVPLADVKEENFDKMIAVTLRGVFLTMKYAIPEMLKTGGGSIINTGSIAAMRGFSYLPSYSAAKAGVVGLSLAASAAYSARGLRANCIHPGPTLTARLEDFVKENPEAREKMLSRVPSGRFMKPEEVAQLALFFAADESVGITGTSIPADLGFTSVGFV